MYRPGPGQIFNSVKRSDLALQVCIINEQYVSKNHKILGTWNNKKKKITENILASLASCCKFLDVNQMRKLSSSPRSKVVRTCILHKTTELR